ncbi:Mur ligase family protein [uncultured Sulfitobacter sp.]|uniref:Mur ligase family protein n=1 Tax=uncultured Sulfitobacter sp. TaxID=191468 RepID=UPI00262591DE|nr:Mur ligase family protein [uncultured Sulfitobacter sp.]
MSVEYRSKLWNFESLMKDLGVAATPNDALRQAFIERVDIDGIYCKQGSLYIPRGSNTAKAKEQDERSDVFKALERGASIALTSLDRDLFPAEAPVIQVPGLVAASKTLATKARERVSGTILGITGSVGKTTTKDLMRHMLSYDGTTFATRGNYNEIDGVLMTLASMPSDTKRAIIEVCSTRPNSVPNKAEFVKPHIGMVTVIGHSHGENYPSRYDILRDKVAMLDYLTGDKIAILGRSVIEYDAQNENLIAQKDIGHTITVGHGNKDTVQLISAELSGSETDVRMRVDAKEYRMRVPFSGRQYVDAALFSMAGAHAFGCDLDDLVETVPHLKMGRRRGERIKIRLKGSEDIVEVIDDAQNSAPESVRALLEQLSLRRPLRRVLVLGEMLELGDEAAAMHADLIDDIDAANIDVLVSVGGMTKQIANALQSKMEVHHFKTTSGAASKISNIVKHGDLVALKGAGGLKLEKIMQALAPATRRSPAKKQWFVEKVASRPLTDRRKSIFDEPPSPKPTTPAGSTDQAIIEDFDAFQYKIPMKRGFKTSRAETKVSSNFILTVRIDGKVSVAEASPRTLALTGETRKMAASFFAKARDIVLASSISRVSAEDALEDVRAIMKQLEKLADDMATDENRAKPFRGSLAGMDSALLIAGANLHDMTLTDFLGRQRPDVGVSATTMSVPTGGAKLIEAVRKHLQRYPACRAKGTANTDVNLQILKAVTSVSKETGEDKVAWVDMNEAYTPETAPDLIHAIADEAERGTIAGTVVLEQPVHKRFYREMCDLQKLAKKVTAGKNINLVLMADESLWDLADYNALQEAGGCSAINIKVQKCGGLLRGMEIAQRAKDFDPKTLIYIGGMIGTSDLTSRTLLSLAAALPMFDFITSGPRSNIKAYIVKEPLRWVGSSNILPEQDGAGLGLEMDWNNLLKYTKGDDRERLQSFLTASNVAFDASPVS